MELSNYIDHTILTSGCTIEDVKRICAEAEQYGFYAICIPPYYVRHAARILEDSPVKIATVVGFPMGYAAIPAKVEEVKRAIDEGADELDIVANIAAVKNGDWAHVRNDIDGVTIAVHLKGKKIKLILETGLLEEEEIIRLCSICKDVGVDYVKTSTGYQDGATVEHIQLLRTNLPKEIKIKASGGIRTAEAARQMIEAGADRIGTSSGVSITRSETADK